ncbi:methylmalonyl-CoA mutase family protein [Alteribacillus persepolensis]|nr:methylmalonyl-CoA mutase family protein [Alteribacillus persepolensis]
MQHTILKSICNFSTPSDKEWQDRAEKSLKGKTVEEALYTKTDEDIMLKPLYRKKDRDRLLHKNTMPGQFPHIRGMRTAPQRWNVTQSIWERTPKRANEEIKEGLQKGQHAIRIRWNDTVTKRKGMNHQPSASGVLVTDVADMVTLLQGIDLETTPLHLETGADPLPLFAMWTSALDIIGVSSPRGSVAADPLGNWLVAGHLPAPVDTCFDHAAQAASWCRDNHIPVQTMLVSSEPYHNGGASAVEELAYSMACATTYVRELHKRGITIEDSAASLLFRFSAGSNFFMELAKFRAARALWSNILQAFGMEEEKRVMTLHGITSSRTKTALDPYVNILRAATEAFAAAAGGADDVEVTPFDAAFQRPSTFAKRIARNTQTILQEEAFIGSTIDPAGGSYYVEQLTHELAEKAWELFQDIEADGGMIQSLLSGKPQELIKNKRQLKEKQIDKQKRVLVGANKYPNVDEKPISAFPETDEQEVLAYITAKTDKQQNAKSGCHVQTVEEAEKAVQGGALLHQLTSSQSGPSITPVTALRESEKFEKLRQQAQAYQEQHEKPLSALLVTLGSLAEHKARADFSAAFLQTGGFHVQQTGGVKSVEEAVHKAVSSTESIVVLCGQDAAYDKLAAGIVEKIKAKAPEKTILLAGKTGKEQEAVLTEKGLAGMIYRGANVYETLSWLQRAKGAVIQ